MVTTSRPWSSSARRDAPGSARRPRDLARGWRHHRGVRTRLGLLLAVACAVFGASPAARRAVRERACPTSCGLTRRAAPTVATSPKTIELWFNEEITLDLSSVRVVHSDGAVVAGTRLVSASGDPRLLQLSLPRSRTTRTDCCADRHRRRRQAHHNGHGGARGRRLGGA